MKNSLPLGKKEYNQSHIAVAQKGHFNVALFFLGRPSNKSIEFIIGILLNLVLWYFPSPLIPKTTDAPKKIVEGIYSVSASMPTTQPVDTCKDIDFADSAWDLSHYHKGADGFYLPNATTKKGFWYPPMTYGMKISGVFQKINIEYEASYQSSTSSATFFIAIYDNSNDEVLEVIAPEPNRQLIGFKSLGKFLDKDTPISPVSLEPIVLNRQVAYTRTHTITIKAKKYYEGDQVVTYLISGIFVDTHGINQSFYKEVPVSLPTSDPTIKEFKLVIGTAVGGKLEIKRVNVCDE